MLSRDLPNLRELARRFEGDLRGTWEEGLALRGVELTLADDKITDITVTPHATDPTAKGHQAEFVGGIAEQVVGKDIDTLNVTKVSGSSLTSAGFKIAITAIKGEALES